MVFNIFKRKPKVNTNTAYAEKIRTAHDRLENKSYEVYGNKFDELDENEKKEISVKVAEENE